jgi:hypothetical protein
MCQHSTTNDARKMLCRSSRWSRITNVRLEKKRNSQNVGHAQDAANYNEGKNAKRDAVCRGGNAATMAGRYRPCRRKGRRNPIPQVNTNSNPFPSCIP